MRMLSYALLVVSTIAPSAQPAQAAGDISQGTWVSTLQPRDLNGDGQPDAWYDITLNVTWLANAKAIAGTPYDSASSGSTSDGRATFADAQRWVEQLSVGGIRGWRLPKSADLGNPACLKTQGDCFYGFPPNQFNELAHLYKVTLGNASACDDKGQLCREDAAYGLKNTGPFQNMDRYFYWSSVERSGQSLPHGRFFDANYGFVNDDLFDDETFLVMVVHDGDAGHP